MPIYEYLCPSCNRIFSFLVKSLSEKKEPTCPRCGGREMERRISRFAVTGRGRKSPDDSGSGQPGGAGRGGDPLDDPRVAHEMMRLMSQAESMDESDPRQMGRLMRRMTEITGEPLEPEMEEAMRRLEAGEDPEKIEEGMGGGLGGGEGGAGSGDGPTYDDGLYPL